MRHPRRAVPEPQLPQSLPPSRPRHRAPQPGPRFHGRDRRHHRAAGRSRQGRAASPRASQPRRQRGALLRRPRPRPTRPAHRRPGHRAPEPAHLHLARSRPAARRLRGRRGRHEERRRAGPQHCAHHKSSQQGLHADGHITYPQVALVALNPHTGQILALVGGRNYGVSQLDHALAERPTGSIFKPFVYAAAYNTSLNGTNLDDSGVFTALTKLNDDPQDFGTNGQSYTPGNFEKGEYPGMVTAVEASPTRSTSPPSPWPRRSATRTSPPSPAPPASSTPAARPRSPSAPTTRHPSTWPAPTPSSPTTASTSSPGCWPACATPTATSSPTSPPKPNRSSTLAPPSSPSRCSRRS